MELDKVKKSAGESGIGSYFKLKAVRIKPEQILLDPRNPRLGIDSEEFDGLEEKEIALEQVQRAVLRQIEKKVHHVKDLVNSIGEKGFLDGLGSFIIKRSTRDEHYLVLEGNRRTAAIKQLLRYPTELSSGVKRSLKEISVSEFQYIPNDLFSEEQIIEILLGIIHLQGPLPWGPLEKARYIYQSYIREHKSVNGAKDFTYSQAVVNNLCSIFPLSKGDVKKNLRIYRVFRQLRDAGYKADSDRFSLIDLFSNDSLLRKEYFEVDDKTLTFSEVGLERLYGLCITPDRLINDPSTFRKFKKIYEHGDSSHIDDIENRLCDIQETYNAIKTDIKQGELFNQLEVILNRIQGINIGAISSADDECQEMMERIVEVVNNRLAPLVGYENGDQEDLVAIDDIEWPDSIEEAQTMPGVHLKPIIVEVLRERPNKSCVKDQLVKYVLEYLEILTRGEPRKWFSKKIDDVVKEMVWEGMIREYQATNIRLQLMI